MDASRSTWTLFLPVRVGDGEDEEVEHVEELPVLGPRHQVVQHVGHRGRADPLPSVDTCTTAIHQVYLLIYITVRHGRFSHALQNISVALSPLVMSVSAFFAWEINKLEVDMIASGNPITPMCSLDLSSTLLILDLMSDV